MKIKEALMLSSISLGLFSANSALSDQWSFEIEPYAQATTIEGDAGIGRANAEDLEVDFDAILEALHMAGMLHFEAFHDGGWGVILDYGFMDLREDISGPRGGVVDAKVRQGVLQAEVAYRVALGKGTLDYLGGIRWWDNDIDIDIDPALLPTELKAEVEEDWVDVFIGARWLRPVSENWEFMLRGDVGGFELEADFTSSVGLGFKYHINDSMRIDLRYKGVWVDYEDGTKGTPGYFAYDTLTHGPIAGFIYAF
jgi:hypothetical protein